MVAQRDLGRSHLLRDSVQHAAPQPRAQRARRRIRVEQIVDDLADGRVLDAIVPPSIAAGLRDQIVLVFLVPGIDVDGDQGKAHGCAFAHHVQGLLSDVLPFPG